MAKRYSDLDKYQRRGTYSDLKFEHDAPGWENKHSNLYKLIYFKKLYRQLEEYRKCQDQEYEDLRRMFYGTRILAIKPFNPQARRLQWFTKCTLHLN